MLQTLEDEVLAPAVSYEFALEYKVASINSNSTRLQNSMF